MKKKLRQADSMQSTSLREGVDRFVLHIRIVLRTQKLTVQILLRYGML